MSKERNDKIYEGMFVDATEGILVSNHKGQIILCNPSAQRMFGYTHDEFLALNIDQLMPMRFQSHHVHHREGYFANPMPRSMGKGRDLYANHKNGEEFPVEISLSHVKNGEETLVVAFIIDIAERKKKDNQLKKANEMLKKASFQLSKLNQELEQKVQSRTLELAEMIKKLTESKKEVDLALEKEKELNDLKSRFISTASHEFRTPLATILSSVSLAGKYADKQELEKIFKHLDRVKDSVSNLTDILNDFLSLDKLEEGIIQPHPEPTHVYDLIVDLLDTMKGITKSGQVFNYQDETNNEKVFIDVRIFRNLLINLVSNAVKYSDENKTITLKTEFKGQKLFILVQDEGIGIPYEDQSNIFERFYRANNIGNIQGTGLGLNIVKKYIEILNGDITFESEPGVGTRFLIEIPV
jgi:PAS domain S-box-containing protein